MVPIKGSFGPLVHPPAYQHAPSVPKGTCHSRPQLYPESTTANSRKSSLLGRADRLINASDVPRAVQQHWCLRINSELPSTPLQHLVAHVGSASPAISGATKRSKPGWWFGGLSNNSVTNSLYLWLQAVFRWLVPPAPSVVTIRVFMR